MGGFGIPSIPVISLLCSGTIGAVPSVEFSSEAVMPLLVAGVVGAVSSAASSIFVWHFLVHVGVKPPRWQPFLLCLFCIALCIVVAAMHPVSVIDVCDRGLVAGILMAAAWSDGTCRLVPDRGSSVCWYTERYPIRGFSCHFKRSWYGGVTCCCCTLLPQVAWLPFD